MTRSSKGILSGVVVIAGLVLLYFLLTRDRNNAEGNATAGATTETVVSAEDKQRPLQGSFPTDPESDLPRIAQQGKLSNSLETGYRWNPDLPGIAENPEDAAWLQAHGYPGPEVERYLMSLSMEALKTLADDGNQSALAVYAYRLAQSGAPQAQTQEALLRSAAEGSAYALKMAGDIYQTVDGYRDPVMASAFYGLLARVGDQGGYGQVYLLAGRLSESQRFQAGLLEESLWRSLIARNGGFATAATSQPRPGYLEFLGNGLRSNTEGNNDVAGK